MERKHTQHLQQFEIGADLHTNTKEHQPMFSIKAGNFFGPFFLNERVPPPFVCVLIKITIKFKHTKKERDRSRILNKRDADAASVASDGSDKQTTLVFIECLEHSNHSALVSYYKLMYTTHKGLLCVCVLVERNIGT